METDETVSVGCHLALSAQVINFVLLGCDTISIKSLRPLKGVKSMGLEVTTGILAQLRGILEHRNES
jgi:hypothetical protein